MRCPQCDVELSAERIGLHEVQVDECPTCGGLWLDRGELAQLSDGPSRLAASTWSRVDTKRRLKCPRCTSAGGDTFREGTGGPSLRPIAPADEPDLVLDRCEACEGFWLDGGELQRMRSRQWKEPPAPEAMPFGQWLRSLLGGA